MKIINHLFLKGFIVVMPLTLTLYLLYAVCVKAESIFGNIIKSLLGEQFYLPGLGIVLTLAIILLVGVLVSNYLTSRIVHFFISQFEKVPFLRAIYGPLKDLMSMFSTSDSNEKMKRVVLVDLEGVGFKSLGLVTREDFSDLNNPDSFQDRIAVYIPMSYMIGGFTAFVERSKVEEVDIPVDKALKLALTGWIQAENNNP